MGDFPSQPIYYNRQLLQIGWDLPEISFSVGWRKFVLLICRNVCFPKLQRRRAPAVGLVEKTHIPPRPLFSSMFPIACTRKGEPTSSANAWCRDSQKLTTGGRP
jgi:hypothetical protein